MPRLTFGLLMLAATILPSMGFRSGPANPLHSRLKASGAEDSLGIVVNRSNPVENLSFAELRKIF